MFATTCITLIHGAFLRAHHIPTGEDARIRKQADFDIYGRSLDMNCLPEASDELFAVAAAHPQYGFTHSDVEQTLQVIQRIAEENRQNSVSSPQYQMLNTEFSRQPIKRQRNDSSRIYAAKT